MQKYLVSDIPQLGYGTWNLKGDQAYRGVLWALELGYRHIDTAQGYHNEKEVGQALKDSRLARSDVFVTTKVGPENYAPCQLRPSVERSLEALSLDHVDLLLLHWPSPHNEYLLETYVAQFAEVYDSGLTRRLGVSNFTVPLLDAAVGLLASRPISTNQVEIHPFLQNRTLVNHCRKVGVSTTAYCPLARGAVAKDAILIDIARRHNATPEQVSLAFLMSEGHIVIPSSHRRERILSNLQASELQLQPDELAQVRARERGFRVVDGDWVPVWDK